MTDRDKSMAVNRDRKPATHKDIDDVSKALSSARLKATTQAVFPGNLPTNLGQAYAIQSRSIESWPDRIGGWKVGGIPPLQRDNEAVDRLAGPIFAASIIQAEKEQQHQRADLCQRFRCNRGGIRFAAGRGYAVAAWRVFGRRMESIN